MSLKNKIAVIAGGNGGLGKAIALELANMGAKVEICGRNINRLIAVRDEIHKRGGYCGYVKADIAVLRDVRGLIKKIFSKHKRIDIFIHAAGFVFKEPMLEKIGDNNYDECFNINTRSVFYFLREIMPIMRAQKSGVLAALVSTAGVHANSAFPVYSASKFATRGLMQSLGKSLGDSAIRCFSLAPAGVNTLMRKKLFGAKDANAQQSAGAVAKIVVSAVLGNTAVRNGGEIVIRKGKIFSINNLSKK